MSVIPPDGDALLDIAADETITVTSDVIRAVEVIHDPNPGSVQGTGTIYVSSTAPVSAVVGDIWLDIS